MGQSVMRSKFRWILALIALSVTGCEIDVKWIRETAAAIDKFSDQIKQTAGENGDLQKLLAIAKKDVDDLIKKAEQRGGRLEEKLVLDLIDQRKQMIQDLSKLVRSSTIEVQGSMIGVTEEFSKSLERLSSDASNHLLKVVATYPPLLPGVFLSKKVLDTEGTELTFRPNGYYYRVSFTARDAADLGLRIDGRGPLIPRNPLETKVVYEISTSSLADRYREQQREFVPIELVELGRTKGLRFVGSLELKPLFPVEYKLTVRGASGQLSRLTVDRGPAIKIILASVRDSMKAKGDRPKAIAARQANIYKTARIRLPYGTSIVDLSPDADDWEMVVTLAYVWGGRALRAVAARSDSAIFPGFFSIPCSVFRDSVVTIFRYLS